jgi:methylenetetrahydrofolate reductase (NADPH)
MKLTSVWKAKDRPTISFELFPARSEKAAGKLETVIDELTGLGPDFVSVTFGAGGSTREGSRQLVEKLVGRGLETIAYFACFGLGPDDIRSVIDDYTAIGVGNVLAVRGDPPKEDEGFTPHPESLEHASDLVGFLRPLYPDLCIGVAGYPEGHIEAESREKDLEYLALKVRNGAEYVITNYCYDNDHFFDFVDRCRDAGIEVPILPGVMPIFSPKMMRMLASLCGATITDEIEEGLGALPEGDKGAVVDWGIEFALRQCRELLERGVPGLHIYTMDRSRSSVEIVNRLRAEERI